MTDKAAMEEKDDQEVAQGLIINGLDGMMQQTIRVKSANGQLIDLRFKLVVETSPVVNNDQVEGVEHQNKVENNLQYYKGVYDSWGWGGDDSSTDDNTSTSAVVSGETNNADTKNPFTTVVLENLAKFLPFSDLVSLRLTCKDWNHAFIPALKGKGYLSFDYVNKSLDDFLYTMSDIKHDHQLPFAKYKVRDVDNGKYGQGLHNIQNLFEKFGTSMTHLNITLLDLEKKDPVFTPEIFKQIIASTSGLQELVIDDLRSIDDDDGIVLPEFWNTWTMMTNQQAPVLKLPKLKSLKLTLHNLNIQDSEDFLTEVLVAATNLETLDLNTKLRFQTWFSSPEFIDVCSNGLILAWTNRSSTAPNSSQIKELILRRPSAQIIMDLVNLNQREKHKVSLTKLRLINLELCAIKCREDAVAIEKFLQQQSMSLKSLALQCEGETRSTTEWEEVHGGEGPERIAPYEHILELPRMKDLEELELDYCCHNLSCQQLHYVFPQLKKLRLTSTSSYSVTGRNIWDILMACVDPVPTLKELIIQPGIDLYNHMEQLTSLFPNVSKLELVLKKLGLMEYIWRSWTQVQSLNLNICPRTERDDWGNWGVQNDVDQECFNIPGLLDELVVGVPKETHGLLVEFLHMSPTVTPNLVELGAFVSKIKTRPGIADLKSLRQLKFDFIFPFGLSDISGYAGLALLNPDSIKSIKIKTDVPSKISLPCMKFIRQSLGRTVSIHCIEKEGWQHCI